MITIPASPRESKESNPVRKELGYMVPLSVIRTLFSGLEEILEEDAPPTFFLLGKSMGKKLLKARDDEQLIDITRRNLIGIMEIKRISENKIVVKLREFLGCSGMAEYNKAIAEFEKGVIAGALENMTRRRVILEKAKCCTQGYTYCEFRILLL